MPSFDISSEVNLQEIDNAVNQTVKEILARYDFKGSKSTIEFDKTKKIIKYLAEDDYKMGAIYDMLQSKVHKRGISLKSLKKGDITDAGGQMKRCEITLVMGIETEKAKEITKIIKESKLKVQAQIQDEKVRVTGKKRDDLQDVMALLRGKEFDIPLQFGNFRD
ncbi:YajQ family cyclic di-GMP-binding protein [bacterium]|nr:YajQ family cyclic di-GMP-binding protein [bacterium]